ncbi:alternative ribosome rescue aminoacyl-tRNA hydrolase ArfB [Larkinella knui]|uniref:Aminoacyl-tRNA hydrolase n=1 Tax=Larkinella knui TaxID=2025310 RepID=A0A3P1CNA3_9BACT|nr:alternative ribosome rescue aminoacyl-tRNA hydrolase ArfB [Larkinella knui]RRB14739.1 aminoacyl-tRNA hydrolase [Larkinella knui]
MDPTRLFPELQFQFARSGGSGGQNVNKVATKAELYFDIPNSAVLSDEEKAVLLEKLVTKVTTEGVLVLYHQTERTQLGNREKVTEKFYQLIRKAFEKEKPRKATRPTKASREEKLAQKKKRGAVKEQRKRVDFD